MTLKKALEENGKAVHSNLYDKTNMTPREFRQEQEFEFDHFIELTNTGIKPNYVNIELFAHEYHRAKLKLLGITNVLKQTEPLVCQNCKSDNEGLPDVYLQELSKVEWTHQTQASLNEQLQILRQFANKLGLYDASDYLKK